MSFWDRDVEEWFRRFPSIRRGGGWLSPSGRGSPFGEFEEMRREIERMFEETMQDVERMPKDLVREYETPTGAKVREVGPLVYGYSVTVGPDGKPKIREFGNVKPIAEATRVGASQITSERALGRRSDDRQGT
jgi:hypothetical protein